MAETANQQTIQKILRTRWHIYVGKELELLLNSPSENSMVADELIIDEEMTPEDLIEIGREWEEFLLRNMSAEEILARIPKENLFHLVEQDEEIGREWQEFLLTNMSAEEILARIPKENLFQIVKQDQEMRKRLIAQLPSEERLVGMKPEERLVGMKPEERLAGITPEELPALMEQIERFLRQHPAKPTDKSE